MKYSQALRIRYPVSGVTAEVVGEFIQPSPLSSDSSAPLFLGVDLSKPALIGASQVPKGTVVALDPRCVVTTATGLVIYNPRQHMQQMPTAMRRWMADNPHWPTLERKPRRAKLSYRKRFAIMKRDRFTCQLCGASSIKDRRIELEVDHKVPVSRGGTNNEINLWTLCKPCNQGKSAEELTES